MNFRAFLLVSCVFSALLPVQASMGTSRPFAGGGGGLSLDDALEGYNIFFDQGGDTSWDVQGGIVKIGDYAASSGFIAANQSAWIETIVGGPGVMSFWWRKILLDIPVEGSGLLSFTDNGVIRASVAGETEWVLVVLPIEAGSHVFRWSYAKDAAGSSEYDYALLDGFTWTPAGEVSSMGTPTTWLNQHGLLSGTDPDSVDLLDTDLDGHLNYEEYVAGTDPTNSVSIFRAKVDSSSAVPVVRWMPDLGAERSYSVEGSATLPPVWGATNSASRFFRVSVDIPVP